MSRRCRSLDRISVERACLRPLRWLRRVVFLASALIAASVVQAEPENRRIVFQPGSQQSLASVRALQRLREDPALAAIRITVLADAGLNAEALLDNGAPDVVLTARHGGQLTADLDALRTLQAAGVEVIGLVSAIDPRHVEAGVRFDPALAAYYEAGGAANLETLIRFWLQREGVAVGAVPPAEPPPESGFVDLRSGRIVTSFDVYLRRYRESAPSDLPADAPRVGLALSRSAAVSGDTDYLLVMVRALEARGLAVVPFFNYPAHQGLLDLLLDEQGEARVDAIGALAFKLGVIPDALIPALEALDVPVFSGIRLFAQSEAQWRNDKVGIGVGERAWQVGNPELGGLLAPTVVASRERVIDEPSGLAYVKTRAIADRVERWAERIAKVVALRRTPAAERRVAVIYYNYPPGKGNVGASYLNVLPESLSVILDTLDGAGYDLGDGPPSATTLKALVKAVGTNPKALDTGAVDALLADGNPVMVSVARYKAWFAELPASLQQAVVDKWGVPAQARTLLHRAPDGTLSFVLPALRFGKLLLAPQPTRGWDLEIDAAYHDVELPPHHAYLAFYLWLQQEARVHAMVHVGTHATHEWLPGKEVGFTAADPSEVMVGAVPQVYPYIVDNIGEGQQAKRRGMAAIVSHLTPPISRASLNPELRALSQAIADYSLSQQRGSSVAAARRGELRATVQALGLDVDLGLDVSDEIDDQALEAVEHHIKDIRERVVPFGLHTFGVAPDAEARRASAEAVASFQEFTSPTERSAFVEMIDERLLASAEAERRSLLAGLAGRYIPAGPGHDPIANPASLPTGKNFYGFDPSRLPSPAAWEAGQRLAGDLIAEHRAEHDGAYPDRMVFNLFSVESNRHEGVQEAQILALLGVEPQWDPRGKLAGVTLVPRDQLGRPRVDVTVLPSGLYRDVFGVVLALLDDAVSLAADAEEPDNPIARNVTETRASLAAQGFDAALVARLSRVRIFGTPTGAYGPGLETPISAESSWSDEAELADVYFSRVGHLFGQGFWGDRPGADGVAGKTLAINLFRGALKGADAVVHSRSSNLYGVLDNDDFYQALGGAALAVRAVDGATPATRVTDLSDPRGGQTLALETYLGREMQSRYLNPDWVDAMLDEGYAGARFVRQVADNLWGWQVTVPEAIGAARWQSFHEVYVEDRYDLDVLERIDAAGNLEAYAEMLTRLESVVEKGYWAPDTATLDAIRDASQAVAERMAPQRAPAPATVAVESAPGPEAAQAGTAAAASSSAAAPAPSVTGRQMESVVPDPAASSPSSSNKQLVFVFLVALGLVALGWLRGGRWGSSGEQITDYVSHT